MTHYVVVVGPAGAGKSTFCQAAMQFYKALGRLSYIINLDPGSENLTNNHEYNDNKLQRIGSSIDINQLISCKEIMKTKKVGPNHSILLSLQYLHDNFSWLLDSIAQHKKEIKETINSSKTDIFYIVDMPGQVELWTHSNILKNICNSLSINASSNIMCINLIDSTSCTDASRYISSLLTSLITMANIEMACVNVLSKVDLFSVESDFNLQYYLESQNLNQLISEISKNSFTSKYQRLTVEICDIIESYDLVSFLPLDVNSKQMMAKVILACDTALGYFKQSKDNVDISEFKSYHVDV